MKKLAVGLIGIFLAGCSSFHLGAMHYCPWGQNCETRVVAPQPADTGK